MVMYDDDDDDDDDDVVLLPPALRVPPGGNQVDGLPPASHNTRASCGAPRLGRGQI